jgi:hypothetical protein
MTVPETVPVSVTEPVGGAAGAGVLSPPPPPLQEARVTKRNASATARPTDRVRDNSDGIGFLILISVRCGFPVAGDPVGSSRSGGIVRYGGQTIQPFFRGIS